MYIFLEKFTRPTPKLASALFPYEKLPRPVGTVVAINAVSFDGNNKRSTCDHHDTYFTSDCLIVATYLGVACFGACGGHQVSWRRGAL